MDRFFCVLLVCMMLLVGMSAALQAAKRDAQPVFFSLLFPQLTLDLHEDAASLEARWWEAVLL